MIRGKDIKDKLSDEEVVQRVLMGETELYEVLLHRYNSRLYRIARAIVLDSGEAADIVQHTNAQAYEHLSQFAGRAKFSTWLTKIAIHEASLRRRRRSRFGQLGQVDSPKGRAMALTPLPPTPEEQLSRAELRKVLEAAIDGLPERQRIVQTMRDIEGMSTAETAECLHISTRNAKVLLHRARATLRKNLYAVLGSKASDLFRFYVPRCDRVVNRVLKVIANGVAGQPAMARTLAWKSLSPAELGRLVYASKTFSTSRSHQTASTRSFLLPPFQRAH